MKDNNTDFEKIYESKGNLPDCDEELEYSEDGVEWFGGVMYSDSRHCMLKPASGYGSFGEGFCVSHESECDTGLILDTPKFWRYKK